MKALKHTITFEKCDFENPEHLNALVELTNHYMADPMGGATAHNKLQQLRLVDGLANHPTAEIYFAVEDCKAVGMATCFVNFSTFNIKPYLYIHDFVVHSAVRGKGISKALLAYLIDLSTERGYCKLTLEVRTDNKIAKSLYARMGFEACEPEMLFWTKKIV
ncbi:MAG: GNAT family N-acetyltransferase [Paludibacter sp.]|nr:GNAT family N-acetyltransferase [Paludibacter sp.]